jgi:hypothetical protein
MLCRRLAVTVHKARQNLDTWGSRHFLRTLSQTDLCDAPCRVGHGPLVRNGDDSPYPLREGGARARAAVLSIQCECGGLARGASHVGQGQGDDSDGAVLAASSYDKILRGRTHTRRARRATLACCG